MKRRKAREFALQILYQYDITGHPPDDETFNGRREGSPVAGDVNDFAKDLVLGTIENIEEIDGILLSAARNWEIGRIAAVDRGILRLSIYELLFRDDIPAAVTLNEAIEIAKKYSTGESYSFINGILDNVRKTINKRVH
ncbi:hypothetical protein BMS3Bbin06_01832 [bacterium BMS3Bbin06]|nr:hypothetical protein BMS3Abin08_01130 [bacterium BMS3Abin08]GBE35294.1 hypothetical protein BMS3Bbin06_01832 [bacterium BMS3Bbin06]HDO35958.1 transcription antitermination factor NusB [Nitrospirota bacterium]HDY70198.1 transcription antitermination factor NusB [Nitrospirota bacterium]